MFRNTDINNDNNSNTDTLPILGLCIHFKLREAFYLLTEAYIGSTFLVFRLL